jgi:hypothetical protein
MPINIPEQLRITPPKSSSGSAGKKGPQKPTPTQNTQPEVSEPTTVMGTEAGAYDGVDTEGMF